MTPFPGYVHLPAFVLPFFACIQGVAGSIHGERERKVEKKCNKYEQTRFKLLQDLVSLRKDQEGKVVVGVK